MEVQVQTVKKWEGGYRVAAVSGLITGVAAAAPLFSLRWSPPTAPKPELDIGTFVLQRLRARLTTVAGYTAAQEAGIDVILARNFTAADSGGTSLTLTTNNAKKRTDFPLTKVASINIATTAALTAGTRTLDAQPIAAQTSHELAQAATVQTGFSEVLLTNDDLDRYPVILSGTTAGAPTAEGLIVRNLVSQGAGGTARLIVEIDWLEVQRY